MRKSLLGLALVMLAIGSVCAQSNVISGVVQEFSEGKKEVLIGANVYWLNTTNGAITNEKGEFSLSKVASTNQLVVSFVGYMSDTVAVNGEEELTVILRSSTTLEDVVITQEQSGIQVEYLNPLKSELISEKELLKAACCNLSESFETNPSVDVSFTDAVTGTRQIQMLGLSGPYIQITRENMPDVRGLSSIYGMVYIPGTWIESIQLNKGTGSVVNGFESVAGQINVELRKPEEGDRLYLNIYGNEGGRLEANVNLRNQVNYHWSTATLLHAKNSSFERDRNEDGFLDMPLSNHFIGLNRWKYIGDDGLRVQLGVKATYLDNIGGQVDFDKDKDKGTTNAWGMHSTTKRIEGWTKVGWVFEDQPWKSFGLQMSGLHHDQASYFGLRDYDATQNSFYSNFIYHTMIGNTNHKVKTGLSLQYDEYEEVFDQVDYSRTEIVPGSFLEYNYSSGSEFSLMAGVRLDHHNAYGAFVTPRLHARYEIVEGLVARGNIGRGQRTANVLAENVGMFASSREVMILGDDSDKPYGLEAEVAWNYGLSLVKNFTLDYREGILSVEYYRTNFENQIVADFDSDVRAVSFYNLEGQSYSNSFQAQVDYELFRRFDVRIGYRWFDVQTTYGDVTMKKPLVSAQRTFVNLGYKTRNKWMFDYTINWQGEKRLPSTAGNPVEYQLEDYSPSFVVMNLQVSKAWKSGFEAYVGMENMLNYAQSNPIVASEDPFGDYFDSSMVWGPIFGRNTYLGLRYRLK
ncbi:MAG: TonB-dependent receptor [Reichenbachiella sp.]